MEPVRERFAAHADVVEAVFAEPWSDGLPVVAPTADLVDAMVAAGGRPADDVLGTMPQRRRSLAVWQAASCAVMAGCRPEYFPVVLATWDAVFDPGFNPNAVFSSTGGPAVTTVVSGPYGAQIGMNATVGLLGPGNRANATIGRAIRLGALAALDAVPGELDAASYGHAGKYTAHFAERPSPPGWSTLRERLGFETTDTTVTVLAGEAPRQIMQRWSSDPNRLLATIAAAMRDPAQNGTASGIAFFVLLGPEHTAILHAAGLAPDDIRRELADRSRVDAETLREAGMDPDGPETYYLPRDADGLIPTTTPEDVYVMTAGGPGAGWSVLIPAWTRTVSTRPATRKVTVPTHPGG